MTWTMAPGGTWVWSGDLPDRVLLRRYEKGTIYDTVAFPKPDENAIRAARDEARAAMRTWNASPRDPQTAPRLTCGCCCESVAINDTRHVNIEVTGLCPTCALYVVGRRDGSVVVRNPNKHELLSIPDDALSRDAVLMRMYLRGAP